ncbi:MAG: nitronate monooxygenase, partial [Planctomycetota bacterium]
PTHKKDGSREFLELCVAANFAEVFLAREGHDGHVGINYLEKIQLAHLPSIYGAMLAGVAFVLMGAGIPSRIPGVLDSFASHKAATYDLRVVGAREDDDTTLRFDPRAFMECDLPPLKRPHFLPIIASNVLAATMLKRSNGRIDGFVIEGPTAGGHNAPPRRKLQLSETGEPVYGERDRVDLGKIRKLGLPFWVAGGSARPETLREVLDAGGAGVQVGTAFAFCEESAMKEEYKRFLLEKAGAGAARVFTDRLASPSGYPFKVAQLEDSISEQDAYLGRRRICDLGYLREAYRKENGAIGYRCPSEPIAAFLSKGGREEDTKGRKCICNSLLANIGHPQIREDGTVEKPLITCGDDLLDIARFLPRGQPSYTARDVIENLLRA